MSDVGSNTKLFSNLNHRNDLGSINSGYKPKFNLISSIDMHDDQT